MRAQLLAVVCAAIGALVWAGGAFADDIVTNATPGYYNQSLGTILDGTSSEFPPANGTGGDPSIHNAPEPNLTAAAGILDGFLGGVPTGTAWSSAPVAIPFSWPI